MAVRIGSEKLELLQAKRS